MSMLVDLLFVTTLLSPLLTPGEDGGTILQPQGVTTSTDCPAPHEFAERRVWNLLTNPLLPEFRSHFDLGDASADHVQLLTDQRDGQVCRALWAAVQSSGTVLSSSDSLTFFRSGNRYFVAIKRAVDSPPPGVIRLDGRSSLDVYDAEYRLVGRFGA